MAFTLQGDRLRFADTPHCVTLSLHWWHDAGWHEVPLEASNAAAGHAFTAATPGLNATLKIEGQDGTYGYALDFVADRPTRVLLKLEIPGATEPFHVVPVCIFGDNNMAHSLGHGPCLTAAHRDVPPCSPTWELRADRAALPLSMLYAQGMTVGISIDPYAEGAPLEADAAEAFTRNGLYAAVAHDGAPDACGACIGHAQLPNVAVDKIMPITWHHTLGAAATGRIYLLPATSRLTVHDLMRAEYPHHRACPEAPISRQEAIDSLLDAFVTVNWHGADGRNALGWQPPVMTPFFGGTVIRENFTNMRCNDAEKVDLQAWRTLAEIGWSGGSAIAAPVLEAGRRSGHADAVAHAVLVFDAIAAARNPASGLLWDVAGKHEGKRANWWWSGYMVMDCHCAYTNGSAVWHLLQAYRAELARGHEHAAWRDTAIAVLDTIITLQLPDGNFGYTYELDRPAVLSADGHVGVWFAAALAHAYELTGKAAYATAARRGLEFYHARVCELSFWGAPMDQFKWPDQEGNLGLIRAAAAWHRLTGDAWFLEVLRDAAHYEYLWRYGQRTRPQAAPLKDSHWNSCGGSPSGVFAWQHPMGLIVDADLLYLADQTGDDYHRQRAEDSMNWGINTVSIYPEVTGYGRRGVMTECYCQSNPRPGELRPDGTPSALWHSYNGWAAAATLEGLLATSNDSG